MIHRPHSVPNTRRAAALVACALGAACGSSVTLEVRLQSGTCGESRLDPLDGVTELRFTIYGAGLTPTPVRAPRAQASLALPEFEVGTDRNLVVEGLQGDVAVSRGETGPMDLTALEGVVPVTVWLRRVDGFTPATGADGACSQMVVPRAGHTATLLDDGRVLITGGFVLSGGEKEYLPSTELYDPRTGKFTPGPPLKVRRAFHTATAQPKSSLVVIAGGEFGGDGGRAIRVAEVFDRTSNAFQSVLMQVGRVRHAAAASPVAGRVILVGGRDTQGLPLRSTEVFEPRINAFVPGPDLPAPRAGASAATLPNASILVAGGWDGAQLLGRAEFLVPDRDGTFSLAQNRSLSLNVARTQPLLASLSAFRVVALGGYATADLLNPYASAVDTAELAELEADTFTVTSSPLLARRGDSVIAQLPDGTALVAGGVNAVGASRLTALATAELVSPASGAGEAGITVRATTRGLRDARWLSAATVLKDGSVLVTGGLTIGESGRMSALDTAELFQPRYQASAAGPYR